MSYRGRFSRVATLLLRARMARRGRREYNEYNTSEYSCVYKKARFFGAAFFQPLPIPGTQAIDTGIDHARCRPPSLRQ